MKRLLSILTVIILFIIIQSRYSCGDSIAASKAGNYIGQNRTACGNVASTKYAFTNREQPTLLNLDRPYPNQAFTVVIWGDNRDAFVTPPETLYHNRYICVTGKIKLYRGKPEVIEVSRQTATPPGPIPITRP